MREAAELTETRPQPDAPAARGLAELYERHAGAALRLGYLLTGDHSQAEDLVQEAFVRCVGRFRYLRVPDAFDSYLRRAIVNLHTSGLRHKRVERAWLAREGARAAARVSSMPDVGARQDLWRELLKLPPRQRAAIVLRYYEDLSEREAAEVLGCSVAAMKSLTARAADALRGEIRGEDA